MTREWPGNGQRKSAFRSCVPDESSFRHCEPCSPVYLKGSSKHGLTKKSVRTMNTEQKLG